MRWKAILKWVLLVSNFGLASSSFASSDSSYLFLPVGAVQGEENAWNLHDPVHVSEDCQIHFYSYDSSSSIFRGYSTNVDFKVLNLNSHRFEDARLVKEFLKNSPVSIVNDESLSTDREHFVSILKRLKSFECPARTYDFNEDTW